MNIGREQTIGCDRYWDLQPLAWEITEPSDRLVLLLVIIFFNFIKNVMDGRIRPELLKEFIVVLWSER